MPGTPFINVQSGNYWSSTSNHEIPHYFWYVYVDTGFVLCTDKSITDYVWPVRGGK